MGLGVSIAFAGTAHAFQLSIPSPYYFFLFFSSTCAYSFHWYWTTTQQNGEKDIWSLKNKNGLFILSLLTFLAGLYCAIQLPLNSILYAIPLVLMSIVYTAPKIPHFKQLSKYIKVKSFYLALAWSYTIAILPFLVSEGNLQKLQFHFGFQQFAIFYAICILFDYRDRVADMQGGIKNLLYQFGGPVLSKIMIVLCCASILSIIYCELAWSARFLLWIPAFIFIIFHRQWMQQKDDFTYYGIIDGLLFVNGLLMLL
jgi:4-hydroxybenzoate polyprenyltransferase